VEILLRVGKGPHIHGVLLGMGLIHASDLESKLGQYSYMFNLEENGDKSKDGWALG